MSKKKNKKKGKKTSVKKERYTKFRKEKPGVLSFVPPDLSEEIVVQRRQDEKKIENFWRYYRRPPERFVRERDAKARR